MLRHMTSEERVAMRELFEKVGAQEILGVVAGLVANNVEDSGTASDVRILINKAGKTAAKALGEKEGERV